jgi:hypothetical protein
MMNHPDRMFSFQEIESEGDLVEAMFNHKWPLCYSFYHGKLLYLNDGESEEMPEYAVVTIDKTEGRFGVLGREVGRIKPKSMTAEEVPKYIRDLNAYSSTENSTVRLTAEPKWHHHCQLCGLEEE